jgi:uncharacterized membrane protein YkvA (DUF1232 family)
VLFAEYGSGRFEIHDPILHPKGAFLAATGHHGCMAFVLRRSRNGFVALGRALFTRGGPGLFRRLGALPRLVGARFRGEYRGVAWGRLIAMAVALVYLVSPVDFVPEAIFGFLGLGDDGVVLLWLVGTVFDEAERYLAWEVAGKPRWPSMPRGQRPTYSPPIAAPTAGPARPAIQQPVPPPPTARRSR